MEMMRASLISLDMADGTEIDIPANAVIMFEGMKDGKNENFPNARCYLYYLLGKTERTALITNTFADVLKLLDINAVPGNWMLVTRSDGDRLAVQKQNVVARRSATGENHSSTVTLVINQAGELADFDLQESMDELRGKSTLPAMSLDAPPAGLIQQPDAVSPRPRRKPSNK